MPLDVENVASRVGLDINSDKTNIFNLTGNRIFPICINGQRIEGFEQFVYLTSSPTAGANLMLLDVLIGLNSLSLFWPKYGNATTSTLTLN